MNSSLPDKLSQYHSEIVHRLVIATLLRILIAIEAYYFAAGPQMIINECKKIRKNVLDTVGNKSSKGTTEQSSTCYNKLWSITQSPSSPKRFDEVAAVIGVAAVWLKLRLHT
uniref:CSON012600 protein n=1 Tax=Culicoides sonorensis TaxID=179676 RepID=A0A336KL73_CULSO